MTYTAPHFTPMELIKGAYVISGALSPDERGYFQCTYNKKSFEAAGLPTDWKEDNISFSQKFVLRGLHFNPVHPQGKLIRCVEGIIYDAFVDLRPDSSTFKQFGGMYLHAHRGEAIYLPPGVAHGFLCVSDFATIHYKVSEHYDPENDTGVYYADPEISIPWPLPIGWSPILSKKDAKLPLLSEYLKTME